ncbi:MAG TPA: virulence factor TspB C-terminal domain-related protein [Burkholderiales bacterium]|nr:virulence factor TspB C-terminal domain-related protein [Burkholderiales bacterium]
MRAVLIVVALVLLALGDAHAIAWNKGTDFAWSLGTGNITAFPTPGTGNVWMDPGTSRAATAGGNTEWTGAAKKLPFNPSPSANFKASFTARNLAKSLISPGILIPLVGGQALSYLMEQACVRIAGGTMQLANGSAWEECHYSTLTLYATPGFQVGSAVTTDAGAKCEFEVNHNYSSSYHGEVTAAHSPQGPYDTGCNYYGPGVPSSYWGTYRAYWLCPPTNLNIQVTYANVASPPSCGTQQVKDGWQNSTAQAAEDAMTTKLAAWTQCDFSYGYGACGTFGGKKSSDIADALMNGGATVQADLIPPTVESPLMEPPTQTTFSDPASGKSVSTTEQVENDYSCLVISGGQAITCSQAKKTTSTTATTTNPNGTGTVTTTATTVVNKGTTPSQDVKCQAGTLGCAEIGVAPAAEAIPTQSIALSMTEDAGWNLATAACPAPHAITVMGHSYQFGLQGMCDFASGIRPMVVAMAYLSGAVLFFGLARRG